MSAADARDALSNYQATLHIAADGSRTAEGSGVVDQPEGTIASDINMSVIGCVRCHYLFFVV